MTSPSLDERYAPPQAHVEDIQADAPSTLASRWTRLFAVIIDGLLSAGILWLVAVVTPINVWAPPADGNVWMPRFGNILVGLLIFFVLQGYLLAVRGQTIGKFLLKTRIVRPDDSRVSVGRIFGLRYGVPFFFNAFPIVGFAFAVIDAVFIFRESRRCLHDSIADTIVVRV
ncbi:MAG: RDD family protein [Variovorax sp.]